MALPKGHQPIVVSPDGQLVLCARTTGDRVEWLQVAMEDGRVAEVALPIQSTRGITWDPSARYLTATPPSYGLSSQMELYELDFEP